MRAATSNSPVNITVNPMFMRLAQVVIAATVPLQQLNGPSSGQQNRPPGQLSFSPSFSSSRSGCKASKDRTDKVIPEQYRWEGSEHRKFSCMAGYPLAATCWYIYMSMCLCCSVLNDY